MTLPSSDAQSSRILPRRPQLTPPPAHSIPAVSPIPSPTALPMTPSIPRSTARDSNDVEPALDFATHSWDLATGGLKTLTAKRELPTRPDRRTPDLLADPLATTRNYVFALVILFCVVLLLIGGGVMLFVMLQQ